MLHLTFALLVIVLEFDGSFRPPRDPGCRTIPAKIATCSASISISSNDAEGNTHLSLRPLALGSYWVPMEQDMTSAHAEYHGLLLGLEHLAGLEGIDDLVPGGNGSGAKKENMLLIRGDCKTVTDQLNGRSTPRKLEALNLAAQELLSQLGRQFDHIEAAHIPRAENKLCDNICSELIDTISSKEACNLAAGVEALVAMMHQSTIDSNSEGSISRPSKSIRSPKQLFARYFQPDTFCRIRYSQRPSFYHAIASLCANNGDFDTLIEIGERQTSESALQKDKYLLAQGIRNQIAGWHGIGNDKKALQLAKQHNFLLAKFDRVDQPSKYSIDGTTTFLDVPVTVIDGIEDSWLELRRRFRQQVLEQDWDFGTKLWVRT